MPTSATPLHAVREALTGFIDYAGLFPPAQLPLENAVAEYLAARNGPYAWMLGRFVVRQSTALQCHGELVEPRRSTVDGRIPLSVIVDRSLSDLSDLEVQALEVALAPDKIASFADETKQSGLDVPVFVELPRDLGGNALRTAFDSLKQHHFAAKIRCGGPTADAVPSSEWIASFIETAIATNVPFKATAGLHHPIRGFNRQSGFTMHGFLNMLAAAALAQNGNAHDVLVKALNDEAPANFAFDDESFVWNQNRFSTSILREVRSNHFRSYGSCSFEEPTSDLRALGMIP